jgi:hypothetical protein
MRMFHSFWEPEAHQEKSSVSIIPGLCSRGKRPADSMKNSIIRALSKPLIALIAISCVTRAEANPWWWPIKARVKTAQGKSAETKTVQLDVPVNNGGVVSITLPAKSTSARHVNGHARSAREAAVDQRDEERIAADLERHF